ncbi:Fur family ferric uptake transcriptional regulator [Arcticibacter tournemirensis]|uniref:Transcriptional repressor n=1 Tax=Arcticibacter tournemirensis TaxID=699437 RepID=A0A4Q0M632_9SPHI|nr:transcriptional repressor [Arcticibacter tournemirensis]KAA8485259.1 transcriptional repressor [Arcticibacter tournemirensis]RXF68116.1 transcriptional repressor [Arcticibacter tournemirensis]TQM50457.1 Fur family ferric uptake transcriptional regulator [Arcticibacter tournemirensis]
MDRKFDQLLEKHNLKKTTPRYSVLGILSSREMATSQPDLEEVLGKEIDRVTLYRILKTFEEKGIIHKIIDLNGTANYALCQSECKEHEHHDEHLHFNCTVCGKLFCLNGTHLPPINLPAGFKAKSVSLIVSGVCDKCSTADN